MFLLPAGESTFLGCIKSMIVESFSPTEELSFRLRRRNVPLLDEKIVLVTGRGKNADAKVPRPIVVLEANFVAERV
jgi:hypothetical protein